MQSDRNRGYPVINEKWTTPLFLNGDKRLNPIDRLRFYAYHHFRNKRENVRPLEREIYWPTTFEQYAPAIENLTFDRTPSRILCNVFWSLVDWAAIRDELGPLTIHDIGCGSGRYGKLVRDFAGFPIDYYGYEIAEYKTWAEYADPRTKFALYDGHTYESTFAHAPNVFISQSALEHIPNDLAYFQSVTRYSESLERVVQIHMVPGATGLKQWGLHGWRQYNRELLRRIQATLGDGMEMTVFCLGGRGIVYLHSKWVHNRRRHKSIKRDPAAQAIYKKEWLQAVADSAPVGVDQASFLTILIEKGLRTPLWRRLLRTDSVGDRR
jgi:SAM-dependent methyltransferase